MESRFSVLLDLGNVFYHYSKKPGALRYCFLGLRPNSSFLHECKNWRHNL